MPKYRITFRCGGCGETYKKLMAHRESVPRKCPCCGKSYKNNGLDEIIASGKSPAMVKEHSIGKAMDATAKMVMEDYGMTDMKDNFRLGETLVPGQTPEQKQLADAMFGGEKKGGKRMAYNLGTGRMQPMPESANLKTSQLAQRAMQGAFRAPAGCDPISQLHASKVRPPVRYVNER